MTSLWYNPPMPSDTPKNPNSFLRPRNTLADLMDEIGHWRNRPVEDHDRGIRQACDLAAHILSNRDDGRLVLAQGDPEAKHLLTDWYRIVRTRGRRV
ncbi:MAG: hypothetical protein HYY13_10330 [Nitrospirae bacterium]|nr:hypothetical protein [Nitrospirota bacterium]